MTVTRCEVSGHEAFTVSGRALSVTCMPGRGAHLCSLLDLRHGHEWLDVPAAGPCRNPIDADSRFEPHQEGCDDCFPTVLPDIVRGVGYEDHGSVWQRAWRVRGTTGRLDLDIELPASGLACVRSIAADGDGLRLDWRISNRRSHDIPYIWCWHPLIAWHPGDRLELTGAERVLRRLRRQVVSGPWPRPAPGYDLSRGTIAGEPSHKAFVPGAAGAVVTSGPATLAMAWDPLVLPAAGVYIKHYEAHQHWAIEPTNLAADRIGAVAAVPAAAILPAHGERAWSIRLSPV